MYNVSQMSFKFLLIFILSLITGNWQPFLRKSIKYVESIRFIKCVITSLKTFLIWKRFLLLLINPYGNESVVFLIIPDRTILTMTLCFPEDNRKWFGVVDRLFSSVWFMTKDGTSCFLVVWQSMQVCVCVCEHSQTSTLGECGSGKKKG